MFVLTISIYWAIPKWLIIYNIVDPTIVGMPSMLDYPKNVYYG